jgi:hypothetical protein
MKYLLIGAGCVVGFAVLAFIGLIINLQLASARVRKRTRELLRPVLDPLAAGRAPDPKEVAGLASNLLARGALYTALRKVGREQLIPPQFRTAEALAESEMARWLSHPNELAAIPSQIHLVKVVPVKTDVGDVQYYLFRFCTQVPHWAADKGWMAGVAGPYRAGELHGDQPGGTFSELESIDARDPRGHVETLHAKTFEGGGKPALAARSA